MINTKDHHLPEEIRQQILAAAEERFRVFGFNKTTMAEIAKDCDMSAANLYRYFENKLAIAASLTRACLGDEEQQLSEIVDQSSRSAAERLRDFVFASMRYTYKQCSETPRINELVDAVCHERMDIVEHHIEQKKQVLVRLIEQGNASEEFDVASPGRYAEAILTALTLFDVPTVSTLFPFEILEQKAQGLVELILNGVRRCPAPPQP